MIHIPGYAGGSLISQPVRSIQHAKSFNRLEDTTKTPFTLTNIKQCIDLVLLLAFRAYPLPKQGLKF